jgi:hypothetical protein
VAKQNVKPKAQSASQAQAAKKNSKPAPQRPRPKPAAVQGGKPQKGPPYANPIQLTLVSRHFGGSLAATGGPPPSPDVLVEFILIDAAGNTQTFTASYNTTSQQWENNNIGGTIGQTYTVSVVAFTYTQGGNPPLALHSAHGLPGCLRQ